MTIEKVLELNAKLDIELVGIKEACFHRKDDIVTVPEFWVSKYPITNEQYSIITNKLYDPSINHLTYPPLYPVSQLTWNAASRFCTLLGLQFEMKFELPTVNQFEVLLREGNLNPITKRRVDERKVGLPPTYLGAYNVTKFKPDFFGVCGVSEGLWCWTSDKDETHEEAKNENRWFLKGIPKYTHYKETEEIVTSFGASRMSKSVGFRIVYNPSPASSYLASTMHFLLS